MKREKIMDWPTFIGTVIVLLVAVTPMMVFPKASEKVITDINSAISNSIGSVYLFMGLIILFFVLYIAFGRYGNVTLGKATDRPEFNNFSWASMLFCAGIGSDILYWGVIEWAFYYQVPPNGAKGMSDEALTYATQYGMFHWGPIAWAIYVLPALPIIYGTLGCLLFFGIFGNYAVYLQITGEFNVINFLNSHGTEATIIQVMHQLPFSSLIVVLFLISAFLFLATTFDSGSYILAAASQKKVIGEPLKANRLFWAFALCLLPFSLMLVGGERALEVLKTASILASVPLIVIFIFMMISFIITLNRDRIKLETRADKHKEIERRSLRIVQVKEKSDDDDNL